MRASLVFALPLSLLASSGCGSAPQRQTPGPDPELLAALSALSPDTLPAPPADSSNQYADDPRAAALGQKLFFDPLFSGRLLDGDNDGSPQALGKQGETGRVACAGCHIPASGFVDSRSLGQQISLAAGWGLRKAPSLLDVGQDKLLTWDGRRDTLYNQVFGPIESPVEMNSSRLFVASELARRHRPEYEAVFGKMPAFDDAAAFPQLTAAESGCRPKYGSPQPTCDGTARGVPGDGADFDGLSADNQDAVTRAVVNLGKAVGAYERLLTCGPSRFDDWMHGQEDALSESEQRGAYLFVGKAKCVSCHSGPFLSDQKFHNVGLGPKPVGVVFADLGDKGAFTAVAAAQQDPLNVNGQFSDGNDGRLDIPVTPALQAAFKTPMLRCVGERPSFMHTAQIRTLAQVVEFFDRGGDGKGIYGVNELSPLGLTADERADLVAFLQTLTGPGPDAALLTAP
ncbi:MAG TPA: cytochrome c peroxidase [Polyangiaceae bacterium]|nr:cytochrome c peroxidase [Polyangiaceae bacterium]